MGILDTIINTVAASVVIRNDDDAIRHLLEIIQKHNIELSDLDQAVVNMIKAGNYR